MLRDSAVGVGLAAMVAALWLLTHRVYALSHDAQIYTFEALARVEPHLLTDLFFQQSSQDRYTVFPRLYAFVIERLGARNASIAVELALTAALLAAAWILARQLMSGALAGSAVALLALFNGAYGAYAVFHLSEGFLSARLPAEALVLLALAAHHSGARALGVALAGAAFAFHPIMALPGMLLLLYLSVPTAVGLAGAAAGLVGVLGLCAATLEFPALRAHVPIMDPAWLALVRERSQFLFLTLWTRGDWETNLRPFLSLTLSALVLTAPRLRRLCVGGIVVGATGLGIALIASTWGPVAILLQGQAWRWVWCTELLAILLLVPTALGAWRHSPVGPWAALALLAGWTLPALDPLLLTSAAVLLWLLRSRVPERLAAMCKGAALAGALGILCWTLSRCVTLVGADIARPAVQVSSRSEPRAVLALRQVLDVGVPGLLVALLLPAWLHRTRSTAAPLLAAAGWAALIVYVAPATFAANRNFGTAAGQREFADWRAAIAPTSTVFVADGRNEGSFVWFTLERPNYLSPGQSAGVVFSAAAAQEILRRSTVLMPLSDPDWRIMTELEQKHAGKKATPANRPLTAENLAAVCRDPALGFVIAKEAVGFAPLRHAHPGEWQDWNLYDCRRVRRPEPAA